MKIRVGQSKLALALMLAAAVTGCASVSSQPPDQKLAANIANSAPRYCVYLNGDGSAVMKYEGISNSADDKSKPCALPVYPNEFALAFGFLVFH